MEGAVAGDPLKLLGPWGGDGKWLHAQRGGKWEHRQAAGYAGWGSKSKLPPAL